MTRALFTLLGAAVAGFLLWIATRVDTDTAWNYWGALALVAGAGLVMALSQLLGGWTKWGWPRMSPTVFLVAFVPTFVAVGWIVVAGQPHLTTTQSHVLTWSGDLGIRGIVRGLIDYVGVFAFGLGLVFGFTFDTTGPPPPAPALSNWQRPEAVDVPTAAGSATTERERVTTPL
jgi:hypothetical protein